MIRVHLRAFAVPNLTNARPKIRYFGVGIQPVGELAQAVAFVLVAQIGYRDITGAERSNDLLGFADRHPPMGDVIASSCSSLLPGLNFPHIFPPHWRVRMKVRVRRLFHCPPAFPRRGPS